jgi:hypothetical protein
MKSIKDYGYITTKQLDVLISWSVDFYCAPRSGTDEDCQVGGLPEMT